MEQPHEHYTHGHHESVLKSHTWRTIGNSAAYLEPQLAAGLSLLDVGCGRGVMLAGLRTLGFEPYGVEHSDEAAWHAREVLHIDGRGFTALLEDVPQLAVKMLPIVAARASHAEHD